MKEDTYLCEKHLAPYLAGFAREQPGRRAVVRYEPVPVSSELHRDFPCVVCGGGVLFAVMPANPKRGGPEQ